MQTIAFEGPDGVGKTTTAKAVAEAMGGVAIGSLPLTHGWAVERRRVNTGSSADDRFSYFLALNREQMRRARHDADSGVIATLDTSIFRTVATHRVLGSKLAAAYAIPPMLRPDATFLIELPEQERIRHLIERDGLATPASHWDRLLFARSDDVMTEYHSFGLHLLDGTLSTEQLVDQVQTLASPE